MTMERWRPSRGLRHWGPFAGLDEMNRRCEEAFGHPFLPSLWWRRVPTEAEWMPPIEMFEKEDKFIVKAELPGMKKEEIDISVVGDTLTIKGERRAETETKEEDYYCCERSYGSFVRSITLPTAVDTKKVAATYEDGVLEISLPKAAEAKPKKVEITVK